MTTDTTADIVVPDAPAIPGLRFRHLRDSADYAPLAILLADSHLADGVEWVPDPASLQVEYENMADFDPRRQLILAEVDGRLVASGRHLREKRDDTLVYITQGSVHPDFRRRGLGRAILHYNRDRLLEMASGSPDDGAREFGAWATEGEVGGRALLESEGYRAVRFGFAMRRPRSMTCPPHRCRTASRSGRYPKRTIGRSSTLTTKRSVTTGGIANRPRKTSVGSSATRTAKRTCGVSPGTAMTLPGRC